MAKGRTTQLTAEEIAAEMLRQFDEGPTEPTTRSLAAALGATSRAIYHYYGSRDEIVHAALGLVWQEAVQEILEEVADPVNDVGDPVEFFVSVGVATRRTFGRHHRIAMHMAVSAQPSTRLSGVLAILGSALESLGVSGDRAGVALYSYMNFVLGSIVLEASRASLRTDDRRGPLPEGYTNRDLRPDDAPPVSDPTSDAIDQILTGRTDSALDGDRAFAAGLRELVVAYTREPPGSDRHRRT